MAWDDVFTSTASGAQASNLSAESAPCISDTISVQLQNIDVNDVSGPTVCLSINVSNSEVKTSVHNNCQSVMASPADVFSQDKDGDTDLHISIIQGEPSLAMNFIAMAPHSDCLNVSNALLQTSLHLAVITRQVDVVRRLITAGSSLNARDNHGNTPLHIASREGYDDIVECLLTPVRFEETVHNTYPVEYQEIPQDLTVKNYDGLACVHLAAMAGSLRSLDALFSAGADVNIGDGKSGRTALHYAVESGDRIILHYLVMWKQTNVNCLTYGGLSPLRLASGRGFLDIVDILITNGADLDTCETDDSYHSNTDGFC